jgi:peptidoglycan hydrolase-like protein with peptidoglycan-binding domain
LFVDIAIFLLGSTAPQAAILDDLVDTIKNKTVQKKRHKKYRRHYYAVSDEKKWQTSLKFLGYYQGKIDGDLYSPESFNAIQNFQKRRMSPASGFLENEYKKYLSYIYDIITLNKYLGYKGKSRRKNNKKIQAALALEGTYSGKIDGVMGKKTKKSILLYKSRVDINATSSPRLSDKMKHKLIEDAKITAEKQLAVFKEDIAPSDSQ